MLAITADSQLTGAAAASAMVLSPDWAPPRPSGKDHARMTDILDAARFPALRAELAGVYRAVFSRAPWSEPPAAAKERPHRPG